MVVSPDHKISYVIKVLSITFLEIEILPPHMAVYFFIKKYVHKYIHTWQDNL